MYATLTENQVRGIFLIGVVIGLFIGALIMGVLVSRGWHNEAVEKGKAEYYLDEDYSRQWRWKQVRDK